MNETLRGDKQNITKDRPNVSDIVVGMGWDKNPYPQDLYVDFGAILTGSDSKFDNIDDFIYYKNKVILKRKEEIIKYMDQNQVYKTKEFKDYCQVKFSLFDIRPDIENIYFVASIFEAESKGYNLNDLGKIHFHIFNEDTKDELMFSFLKNYFKSETSIVFGRLYRQSGEWRYENLSQGMVGTLGKLFKSYYNGEDLTKIGG